MAKSDMVQSLQRSLDVLEQVVHADDGIRLTELADRLGLKKTTVFNLVRTLQSRGYLARDGRHRFHLGPVFDEIMRRRTRRVIFRRAEKVMRELYQALPQATLTFSELVGSEICCRLRLAPDLPGVLRRPQFQVFHAFGSASGLCLQAFNPNYRETMAAMGGLAESGRSCWPDRAGFERALQDTLRQGVAVIKGAPGRRLAAAVAENFVLGISYDDKKLRVGSVAGRLKQAVAEIAAETAPAG